MWEGCAPAPGWLVSCKQAVRLKPYLWFVVSWKSKINWGDYNNNEKAEIHETGSVSTSSGRGRAGGMDC